MKKPAENRVVIAAFTEDQAAELTGISKRQLRYWDSDNFFVPSLAEDERGRPFSRLYSFRDLVALKVLNVLRNEGKVSLSHLREVKIALAHLGEELWSKTTLYVLERRVIFDNPATERREEVLSGQGVFSIPLRVETGRMEDAVKSMRSRNPDSIGRVDRRRGVAHNQLVIAGTTIPVRAIKNFARAGYSIAAIRQEYPTLTAEDIDAAIRADEAA